MAIAHKIIQLNSSTATLVSIPTSEQIAYEHKTSVSVQNIDSSLTIYLGAEGVSSSSYGYALPAGSTFTVDLLPGDKLFALASSGTPNVAIFATEA